MSSTKLHLILVNDSQLIDGTVDVLQEHFQPDMGINCGFIESFDFEGESQKLKQATKQCFSLLRETKMWAFIDEVVEIGCGMKNTQNGLDLFSSLKKILIDLELNTDTTMLIHGSHADLSLALSILTDSDLKDIYQIELSNYSAKHSHNNVTTFQELTIPQVNNNYAFTV
jgi:hypothetical protein